MVDTTDSLLDRLQKARDGDDDALGELLNEFRPYLKLLAERAMDGRLAGRVDSSDVVQQTYLSAVRKFNEFTGHDADALAGWLQRIHERNLIDTARKHIGAAKRTVNRESDQDGVELADDAELTSPSQRMMRGENAVRLARTLSLLPGDQSEVIRLRHLDGWSIERIAERMDRSKRSVVCLLHRGLENLRSHMTTGQKGD